MQLRVGGGQLAPANELRDERVVVGQLLEPRRDGIFVEDIGSTNGTFVNGIRVTRERRLVPGDVVRIGETDLRFEP